MGRRVLWLIGLSRANTHEKLGLASKGGPGMVRFLPWNVIAGCVEEVPL